MKKILFSVLKTLSKLVLKKYKPEIIAITGSVGKTSTKEAIAQILVNKFNIRKSMGNYNNEIGVPLTILGVKKSPGRSLIGWFFVFLRALKLLLIKNKYPEKLVLEFGADHKGDIEYLVDFIPVHIGILTKISKVHIKYFKTIKSVFNEKRKIFKNISRTGWAVINNDDEYIRGLKNSLYCKVMTYGIKNQSDVWATDLHIINKDGIIGMNFKVRCRGNIVPVFLPESLGLSQVYAFLSGIVVGVIYGFNLVEMSIFTERYSPPRGRTNLIQSINNGYIIDDSYNSSPEAAKMSINLLLSMKSLSPGKTIAVLGDMLELGRESVACHKEIGRYVKNRGIDVVLTTGIRAKNIYSAARKAGFKPENNVYFKNKEDLISYLKSIIRQGDIVLIKGSQNDRMEEVVKTIMKYPSQAKNLLVRQEEKWFN